MQLKLTFECFSNEKATATNYKSSAENFKITLLAKSNNFHWAMWLSYLIHKLPNYSESPDGICSLKRCPGKVYRKLYVVEAFFKWICGL